MPADPQALRAGQQAPGSNLRAAFVVLAAFFVFSGADALVKLLSEHFPIPQVTFMVTVAALMLVFCKAVLTGDTRQLWPRHPGLAFIRAALLAGDTLLIYYAFAALPLAEAYVLAFLSPILVAILAFIFLGERLSLAGWMGVLVGFAGVAVALRPGVAPLGFGHAAAIGSALLFALSLVILRRTKATESEVALVASLLVVLSLLSFGVASASGGFLPVGLADLGPGCDRRIFALCRSRALGPRLSHWRRVRRRTLSVQPDRLGQPLWRASVLGSGRTAHHRRRGHHHPVRLARAQIIGGSIQ